MRRRWPTAWACASSVLKSFITYLMPSQSIDKTTRNRNKKNSSKYEQSYSECFPSKCLSHFSINEAVFNYLFPYYYLACSM